MLRGGLRSKIRRSLKISKRQKRLKLSAVLVALALFGQAIAAVLPMSALAQGAIPVCSQHDAGQSPLSPHPNGKAPFDGQFCPICQAGFLTASLLQPVLPALAFADPPGDWHFVPLPLRAPNGQHRLPQQARAPPSLV